MWSQYYSDLPKIGVGRARTSCLRLSRFHRLDVQVTSAEPKRSLLWNLEAVNLNAHSLHYSLIKMFVLWKKRTEYFRTFRYQMKKLTKQKNQFNKEWWRSCENLKSWSTLTRDDLMKWKHFIKIVLKGSILGPTIFLQFTDYLPNDVIWNITICLMVLLSTLSDLASDLL